MFLPNLTKILLRIYAIQRLDLNLTIKCRRLGLSCVQPLLVVLQSVNDSQFLVKNARCLRQSAIPVIRNSVYINLDLTKVEELTTYHRRCRRRELAAARSSTRVQSNQSAHHSSITAPGPAYSEAHVYDQRRVITDCSNPQSIAVLNTRMSSAFYPSVSTSFNPSPAISDRPT